MKFEVYLTNPKQSIATADTLEGAIAVGFDFIEHDPLLKCQMTRYQRYWMEEDGTIVCDFGSYSRYLCVQEVEE